MDGGQDPDCRRGMYWDPARQDADMYAWYKNLLRFRHAHPELLSRNCVETADDERGLLIRRAGNITLYINCSNKPVLLPEYRQKKELIRGEICSGRIPPFMAAAF